MWELRWVLLGLGALLVGGVYLWGSGTFRRGLPRARVEPKWTAGDDQEAETARPSDSELDPEDVDAAVEKSSSGPEPDPDFAADRVVTIRFIPNEKELNSEKVVLALRAAGLQHGRYGIFHRFGPRGPSEPLFSVANLTEPGSFDLAKLAESTIPGMSFFMILPGVGDPITRFDQMVETARALAHELEAELFDEKGSSWSIQRERYVREEIIAYRHQLERI